MFNCMVYQLYLSAHTFSLQAHGCLQGSSVASKNCFDTGTLQACFGKCRRASVLCSRYILSVDLIFVHGSTKYSFQLQLRMGALERIAARPELQIVNTRYRHFMYMRLLYEN